MNEIYRCFSAYENESFCGYSMFCVKELRYYYSGRKSYTYRMSSKLHINPNTKNKDIKDFFDKYYIDIKLDHCVKDLK